MMREVEVYGLRSDLSILVTSQRQFHFFGIDSTFQWNDSKMQRIDPKFQWNDPTFQWISYLVG